MYIEINPDMHLWKNTNITCLLYHLFDVPIALGSQPHAFGSLSYYDHGPAPILEPLSSELSCWRIYFRAVIFLILLYVISDMMSIVHMAPLEWWHMSPSFPPLGPLKMPKLPATCPFVPPHHVDIICHVALSKPSICHHVYLIGTYHCSPHVLLGEGEKACPYLVLSMKSFVNLYQHIPTGLTLSEHSQQFNTINVCIYRNFLKLSHSLIIDCRYGLDLLMCLIADYTRPADVWYISDLQCADCRFSTDHPRCQLPMCLEPPLLLSLKLQDLIFEIHTKPFFLSPSIWRGNFT